MATVDSDDGLISLARQKTGATEVSQHPRSELNAELNGVKEAVAREVESAIGSDTINVYNGDAILSMAKHLFFLRVAERRREQESNVGGANGGVVPEKEIPKGIGRLRRHSFENETLRFWRDEVVRSYNRLTE